MKCYLRANITDFNLTDYFKINPIVKLSAIEATSMLGPARLNELGMMKNNKTLDLIIFSSEFSKSILLQAVVYNSQGFELQLSKRQKGNVWLMTFHKLKNQDTL